MENGAVILTLLCVCALLRSGYAYSFEESFDEGWSQRWVASNDEKYSGRFVVEELKPNVALKVPQKAMHYGLTAALEENFDPSLGVILQFEAKYASGQTCSGAYLKFYSQDAAFQPAEMRSDTPYTVMFGPDVCGSTSKVHLILRHKSPKTGEFSEKHLKSPPRVKSDKKTHVYTAVLKPDNTFEMMVDGSVEAEGSLFEKFEPPINPPAEIPDPDDKKPADWVDDAKMDDPDAVKPEDWVDSPMMADPDAVKPEGWLDDAPSQIPDPDAVKPDDWDEEEDGEWTAPLIPNPQCLEAPGCGEWKRPQIANPDYRGPWSPPKIDNPAYKGEWVQAKIPNPDFYEDLTPLKSMAPIGYAGLELWVMDEDIFFDNIVVTQDAALAEGYREQWSSRNEIEKEDEAVELAKAKEKHDAEKKQRSEDSALRTLLSQPYLEPLVPYLEPAVEFVEAQGQGFYGFLMVLGAITLATMLRWCFRGKPRDDVGQRKKEDIPEPDDPEPKAAGETSSAGDASGNDEDETPKGPKTRRSN